MPVMNSQELIIAIGDGHEMSSVSYSILQGIEQAELQLSGGNVRTASIRDTVWQSRRAGGQQKIMLSLSGLALTHDALSRLQAYAISQDQFLVQCTPINSATIEAAMICTSFTQNFTGRQDARFSCALESASAPLSDFA